MNPQQAWNFAIDELDDSPTARAAAECQIIAYDDTSSNRTLTVLAPNKTVARIITGEKALISKLILGLDILSLNLVVNVAEDTDTDKAPETPASAVWEKVLEILQQQSPRASFDTWIKDTQAAELNNGILIVLVRNAYARDWLSGRVQEQASRLASEFLGERVQVCFEKGLGSGEPEEPEEDSPDAPGSQRLEIEAVASTAYQAIVDTNQKIALPGYALRLLRHGDLTAKEMSLWVAFRQSTYHVWSRGKKAVKDVPYWDVLRYANMSRASFEREVANKDSFSGGLVKVVPKDETALTNDPRFDYARRYEVQTSPRLSRRDCTALHTILYRATSSTASIEDALDEAEKTLTALMAEQPTSYLDAPENQEVSVKGWPKGIVEIVRLAIGCRGDLPESLHSAAEKLQDRIINGFGMAMITLHFLQEAAPRIGLTQAQMWAIIVLRHRCWYDHQEQEGLWYAVLTGGLGELAERLGTSEKSVRRWLDDPAFCTFAKMQNLDGLELPESWPRQTAIFDIRSTEPGQEECDAVKSGQNDTRVGTKCDTGWDKVRHDLGQSETRLGTKCDTGWDKMRHDLGQNDTRLKRFIKLQPRSNKIQESPQATRQNSAQKPGVGSRAYWDWDDLMSKNSVSMPMSKKLLIANKKAERDISRLCHNFVSWMLYAYSEAGRGVNNPVSNALARLQENTFSGAGGDFERLAALTPRELKSLIDTDLAGKELPDTLAASLFEFNFANTPEDYKRELRRRLFD